MNPLLFERDLAEDVTWLLMMNCKPLRYARETLTTSLNFHLWISSQEQTESYSSSITIQRASFKEIEF